MEDYDEILFIAINMIPVILITLFVLFPRKFVLFAFSFLGKAVLVSFIIILSLKSIYLSILYCFLLILLYNNAHLFITG